eukprot:Gb_30498 [translate_table: standard]
MAMPSLRQLSENNNGEEKKPGRSYDPKTMRLKLIHRKAHSSSYGKPSETRMDELKRLVHQDRVRMAGVTTHLQNIMHSLSKQSVSSKLDDIAQAPAYGDRVHRHYGSAATPIYSGAPIGSGEYFVEFEIGTPPQKFVLVPDTGSDLSWVECSYKTNDPVSSSASDSDSNQLFVARRSSTFIPVSCASEECDLVPPPPRAPCSLRHLTPCAYMIGYADGSFSNGILAYETFTINSTRSHKHRIAHVNVSFPQVAFGCSTTTVGSSFAGSQGIMGLGQGPTSFSSQVGYMYGNRFSYCLVDHVASPYSHNFLVFGHPIHMTQRHHSPIQYTPLYQNPLLDSYYYVGIECVRVNGRPLPVPEYVWKIDSKGNMGTIIDSGSTVTMFVEPAYGIILAAFEALIPYPRFAFQIFDLCFNTSGLEKLELPAFSIDFEGGACFHPSVNNYFVDAADNVKCLSMAGVTGAAGFSVIGNLMQQNFFVEYDRLNSRLGFVPTDCANH